MATGVEEVLGVREYSRGAIKRIQLHNFLTYNDVEIVPGPRLNCIMGPNGTGKSSVVCAIAIGLGAHPKVLGRADNLAEFIRTGEDEAFVEIDLCNGPKEKEVTRIRRELYRSSRGGSKWKINGKTANETNVKEFVENEMDIQIKNLCTFLPQEKVGEFSAFDDIGLLRETEKAIGGQELYEKHEKLIEAERSLNDAARLKGMTEDRIEQLEAEKQSMEPDKERLERREEHLKKIDLCKTRILWLKFDEARAKAADERQQAKDAADAYQEQSKKIEPLQKKLNDARSTLSRYKKKFEEIAKHQNASLTASSKAYDQLEDAKAQVEEALESLANLGSRREKLQQKAQAAQAKYTKIQNELDAYLAKVADTYKISPDENFTIDILIARMRKDVAELHQPYLNASTLDRQADQEARRAQAALKEPQAEFRRLTDEKNALENTIELRLEHMAQTEAGNQCRRMREWILKQQGTFTHKVYGPVRLDVDVNQPRHRSLVEAHVPNWIWHAFVCQSKRDYDACIAYASKQGSQFKLVNFLLSVDSSTAYTQQGSWSQSYIESTLRPLGAQGVLSDLVKCEPAVLKALNDHAGLNSALFGEQDFERSLDRASDDKSISQKLMPQGVDRYVAFVLKPGRASSGRQRGQVGSTELVRYQGIRSRYERGDISTLIGSARGKNVLGEPIDDSLLQELRLRIDQAELQVQEATDAFQSANTRKAQAKKDLDQKKKEFDAGTAKIQKLSKAKSDLASAKRTADVKVRELADADKEEERDRQKLKKQLGTKVQATVRAAQQAATCSAQVFDDTIKAAAPCIAKFVGKQHLDRLERAFNDAKQEVREYERKRDDLARAFKKSKAVALEAKKTAETESPCKPYSDFAEELDELPTTVEEVEQHEKIAADEAKAIHDNPALIAKYNGIIKQLAKVKEELENMNADAQTRQAKLDEIRAPWESTLRNALTALRDKFCNYMEQLKARGDVELASAPTYDKWGLVIKVAFRDGAPMSKLEAHVQSGGERSISTIMFLMALQAHMPSPFRVVDEINQGMDEINERIMFKRIVLNSTGPTAPQYFLITPKLLQDLEGLDHPDVRALIVFNGAWNLDNQFPIKEFLSKKRKLENLDSNDAGGDELMSDH